MDHGGVEHGGIDRGGIDHRVIGVVGASGGLGASSLSVALALRGARQLGATVCVDGERDRGGLDVTACLEHLPGLRWPDLVSARGPLDGAALLRALPADGPLRVLAARGVDPGAEVAGAAVEALATVCALCVVDLGRSTELVPWCTEVLVLVGLGARQLADASALVPSVIDLAPLTRLVLRVGRRDPLLPEDVAAHLDLPLATVLRDDARAAADADRARLPGSRDSSALADAADRVLAQPVPSGLAAGAALGPGPAVTA
ncbi:hypothetical protein [Nostocoides sp. HKS02]|uniref:hypothetical protein n=1 Tax=Nostocoides sp. HKS02 TaxID=1813880 RepID=UPI0012B4B2E2|nr:hypothetical protein [Tetrasphaera sp. HKS02]QGN58425.1 hypothetical protein GKE56_11630 [Tetrasphaera sp. HKS02]